MIREAAAADLDALLALYLHLHETRLPDGDRAQAAWRDILADPNHHVLVYDLEGEIVSSCVCVVIPNLTRNARPYAVIENVVTREGHRGKGYATACLDRARAIAAEAGCYKLMLLTSAKDAATLDFYRRAGFDDGEKTAFILRLD